MMSDRDAVKIDPEAWLPPPAPLEMRLQVLEAGPRRLPALALMPRVNLSDA